VLEQLVKVLATYHDVWYCTGIELDGGGNDIAGL
jgi:hypothetical protein